MGLTFAISNCPATRSPVAIEFSASRTRKNPRVLTIEFSVCIKDLVINFRFGFGVKEAFVPF